MKIHSKPINLSADGGLSPFFVGPHWSGAELGASFVLRSGTPMAQFTLEISYSQIAIFNPAMDRPFNNWTDEHFNQGFVWRPQSVSFRTVATRAGNATVHVDVVPEAKVREDAVVAISVPFTLPHEQLEIASVFKGEVIDFEPGDYELIFQNGKTNNAPWVSFSFVPTKKKSDAKILKGGNLLQPGKDLIMTAEPA
jgi:Competence protein J (ComJ)